MNLLPQRFYAYLVTQSFDALNDNYYKMLIQLWVLQIALLQNAEEVISVTTFLYTIPFVIFGPWSGYLADRYSKKKLMIWIKMAEIGVMSLGAQGHLRRFGKISPKSAPRHLGQSRFFEKAEGALPGFARQFLFLALGADLFHQYSDLWKKIPPSGKKSKYRTGSFACLDRDRRGPGLFARRALVG